MTVKFMLVMLVLLNCCLFVQANHEQVSQFHDFPMKPNIFGKWRILSSHSNEHSLQMMLIAVTANIVHKTMFGVSLDLQINGTWYDSNRWMIVYQPLNIVNAFEMNARMEVNDKSMRLLNQELIVNSTFTMNSSITNPTYDSKQDEFVYLPERCKRGLDGTELFFQVNLEKLFELTNTDKEFIPTFLASQNSSKLRVNLFVAKFGENLKFPLDSFLEEGNNFIQVSSVFSLSDKLIDKSLNLQKVATLSHYILGIGTNFIVLSLLLFITPLSIYFHNTKPRSTRHLLPYIVVGHIISNSTKDLTYYFNGEDYLLLCLHLPLLMFGMVFFLFFTNSLLFFYNRKVYNQVYCDIKRKSIRDMKGIDNILAKKSNQIDSITIGKLSDNQQDTIPTILDPPSPSLVVSLAETNQENTHSLKWSKSTKLRISVKITIFLITIFSLVVLLPLLAVTDLSVFILVAQLVAVVCMVFASIFTIITLIVDLYLNRRTLIRKNGLISYFFKNDPLYFRVEMVIQITSSVLYCILLVLRGAAQLSTDRIDHLVNERVSPFFFIAPFIALPLECVTLVLEILGVGGGFVTLMTLCERIKLWKQKETFNGEGKTIRMRYNIRMDSPIFELFGKDLTQVYMDENGFELLRQFSKHEFSIENVAFIGDVEKIYSSLYCCTDDVMKTPQLRTGITSDNIERARELLCGELFNNYIADSAPLCVNVSSGSKQIFSKWIHKQKEDWNAQLLQDPVFIKDFEFVIADVIRNVNDTFCRLKLTSSYKEWNDSISFDQQVNTPTSIMPSIASDLPLDPSIINA